MGSRMRALDWAKTPLGPVDRWPQSLRSALSILLPSRAQIVLFWGPDHVTLYNDAYRAVFGAKHPWALGRPARESWREVWDVLRPLFEGVGRTGDAFWARDHPFTVERYGYPEETYFDISYDPVRDESGKVGGIFCIVSETTTRVLSERRLRTLHQLAARPGDARTVTDACALSAQILESNSLDVPFALVYLLEGPEGPARLCAASGVHPGHPLLATDAEQASGWPVLQVAKSRRPLRVDDLPTRFGPSAAGPWPEAPSSAMLLPILDRGLDRALGVAVLGVSARRPLDEGYSAWLEMLANQVAFSLAKVRAAEEDRRRADALAALDRAKTAFFSDVSHEFRTPLTLLLGPLEEALAEPALAPPDRERLETAHRNGLRLLKLVNTLLDFSRIEAGRADAAYEPTDLAAFTAELASSFRSACERGGLRLAVDCAPLGEPVYVDRDMWEKIVLNLLSNAFKFTLEGEIEVGLRAVDDGVELRVRDTGIGIPADELPHVFERFRRVRGAGGRTHEGTGIGLALVSELVALHGGRVAAESEPERGSTFTVAIPRGRAHLQSDRVRSPSAVASPGPTTAPFVQEALRWLPGETEPDPRPDHRAKAHVLLADDNADMREYVARLLRERWTVTAVADGQAALTAARERRPDLVLADVMMPRLDGFELVRALRSHPETETLPVILLSARAGRESRLEGLERGADDYLVKPFEARELVARVEAHLELGRVREAAMGREQAARVRAERASQAKDDFLATLSHELRTPLNAILGWAVMLREAQGDAAILERGLEVIERNTRAQSQLIEDLLDVSRIISGQMRLDVRSIELAGIVSAAVDSIRLGAEAKGIKLESALEATGGPIAGDSDRLQQVIWNLLSNAVKFTPRGGRIHVSLEKVEGHAVVTVRDTGDGIAPDVLPYVFDRFRQHDAAGRGRGDGLGLGLALVKHLVELHGGTVSASSEGPGQGAAFVVQLPLKSLVENDAVRLGERLLGPARLTGRRLADTRVLVVDDETDTLDLFGRILADQGAQVVVARSAAEALAALAASSPDVLVCDIEMRGEDGYSLLRRLRMRTPEDGGRTPAVAVTAYGSVEDRIRALAAGFQRHLAKPVDPGELVSVVQSVIGRNAD
jgi:signal transduction histidine kinase